MKKNTGNADRIIRLMLGVVIAFLFFTNVITGTIALVLLLVALIFVFTSIIGFCPIYAMLGLNTCPKQSSNG